MLKTEILNIGAELLSGHTINTNAAWLSQKLDFEGYEVLKQIALPDDKKIVQLAIKKALQEIS